MVTFRINVNIYKLTTGTLIWENIDNKVEYKASERGLLPLYCPSKEAQP